MFREMMLVRVRPIGSTGNIWTDLLIKVSTKAVGFHCRAHGSQKPYIFGQEFGVSSHGSAQWGSRVATAEESNPMYIGA